MAYGMHAPAEDGCFGPGQLRYSLVTSEQMVGVFLTVWVGSELMHVRNRKVSCVRRGLMCSLGNKVALTPAHACGAFLYIRIYLTKKSFDVRSKGRGYRKPDFICVENEIPTS